ncbi:hypothetical protein CKY39_00815 [Variovorax boronicumulans]|uniref:DUF3304 domain-containing protein n=1 Tax=Variovorax boronicumulans TaxID=436515 RepID=A0A250DDA0_9BURK|nr:DUF3304 domain-containing protein [Variovorax boronicumulans]ATA51929.1 hypothetical protein CKY39_00815 [Variovorax boronicumulans]
MRHPTLALLLLCLSLAACHQADEGPPPSPPEAAAERAASPSSIGMPIRGYNFTNEGVQGFRVNGTYGANISPYGGGGGDTCCTRIPFVWHEGQAVTVKWTIGHYTLPYAQRNHMSFDEQDKFWTQRTLEKVVPVQRYDEPEIVQVFFLPNDELEVWVYKAGPQNPGHPSTRGYPVDPRQAGPVESSNANNTREPR